MAFKLKSGNKPVFKMMGAVNAAAGMMGRQNPNQVPDQETMYNKNKSAVYKKEEKMYGGTKTYSEAQADSKGQMNEVIKAQKAYEAKMSKDNPDWNKREDNAWKARQNKINEYAGSGKRYEVETGKQDDGGKVKQSDTKTLKGEDKSKTVIKTPEGDKSKLVETKDDEGNITSQKTVEKTVEGTEKLKKKYDKDGNLIRVRGYVTGDKEKRKAAKAEKKALKEEARKNRKANRKNK